MNDLERIGETAAASPYLGRPQTVSALARRLLSGASVSVIGGYGIGKSALLRETASRVGAEAIVFEGKALAAGGAPSAADRMRKRLDATLPSSTGRLVVFLDDARELDTPGGRGALTMCSRMAGQGIGGRPVSVCVSGTRAWRDATLRPDAPFSRAGVKLSPFPMAALDRGRAAALIASRAPEATVSEVARLVALSGNHPLILTGLLARTGVEEAREACAPMLEKAFGAWLEEIGPREGGGAGAEIDARPLMSYLIERGGPVAFEAARRKLGRSDLKAEADVLAFLGVIERRLRGEEATATLRAGCSLFNDWVQARL